MAAKYVWLYGIWPVIGYIGPDKPDERNPSNDPSEDGKLETEDEPGFFAPQPNPNPEPTTMKNFISLGVHVQDALYVDKEVRKAIRMYELPEIQERYPGITRKQLNTARDAYTIGAFTSASLTIRAEDKNKVYPLFGVKHTTTITISHVAIYDEISNFFSNKAFKVGPQSVLYKVVPGTFQIKQRREKPQPIA